MTEQEWLAATDSWKMLYSSYGVISDRKLRLLAVAFCRRILHLVSNEKQRENVELAECCADGLLPLTTLKEKYDTEKLTSFIMGMLPVNWRVEHYALAATGDVIHPDSADAAEGTRWLLEEALQSSPDESSHETTLQADIIRDVVGNPSRPLTLDPSWLTSTVVLLARQMYESRALSTMPILADALQDAGCDNAEVLAHCRSEGPHVRGCWLVDLILGKE